MRGIHFGSQITHLEVSTKTNHPLNRTLVMQYCIINFFFYFIQLKISYKYVISIYLIKVSFFIVELNYTIQQ
jgi:hypothetical protein